MVVTNVAPRQCKQYFTVFTVEWNKNCGHNIVLFGNYKPLKILQEVVVNLSRKVTMIYWR